VNADNGLPDIDCIYDDRKTRPGLRTGAVENLNQRVSK